MQYCVYVHFCIRKWIKFHEVHKYFRDPVPFASFSFLSNMLLRTLWTKKFNLSCTCRPPIQTLDRIFCSLTDAEGDGRGILFPYIWSEDPGVFWPTAWSKSSVSSSSANWQKLILNWASIAWIGSEIIFSKGKDKCTSWKYELYNSLHCCLLMILDVNCFI